MNIAMMLDMAAEAFGERIAVVAGERRLSYSALRTHAQAAAAHLRSSGAAYLALLDVNGPAAPVAIFAAAYAGIPYVPLNYRLTRPEINELVARIAPALLVCGSDYRARIDPHSDVQTIGSTEFLTLPSPEEVPEAGDDPRAVAVQLFTSGTTGKPKAAILRHENLMAYIVGTVEFGAAEADDAILVSGPPYHIAGISAVLSSVYAGRRMVQLESFDPAGWCEAARRENVSNAFLVPTMLGRIVDYLEGQGESAGLPALRALAYGGGKMPLTTIRKAMERLPQVDFTNAYGLTETSSTIAVFGPDDHRAAAASDDPKIARRLACVGKPTSAVEIQIRDEDGRVLAAEEAGLVFVRGAQVSGEYLALGSQLDAQGWFPTRDRGYLDAEGYLFLDGRADDVIVRGGENISPGEIEDVLMSHPAVADAAVVAVPDEEWGEGVAAAVVLKAGANAGSAELQDLVKSRLRSSRVPQLIHFTGELPYNELGKVLRRLVRQEIADIKSATASS